MISKACFQAREQLGLQASRPGSGLISFRILRGDSEPQSVYVGHLWETGKTLREWVRERQKYPDIKYEVDFQIDGLPPAGGTDIANPYALADRIFDLLEKEPIAAEIRDKTRELKLLGENIVLRIREEPKS